MANGHSDFDIKTREEIVESLGAPGIHQLICCINKSMDHHFTLTLAAKLAKLSLNKLGVCNRMSLRHPSNFGTYQLSHQASEHQQWSVIFLPLC